jgi:hypothetical protein
MLYRLILDYSKKLDVGMLSEWRYPNLAAGLKDADSSLHRPLHARADAQNGELPWASPTTLEMPGFGFLLTAFLLPGGRPRRTVLRARIKAESSIVIC